MNESERRDGPPVALQASVGWPRDMFSPHWPPSLKVREQYRVNCDDNSKAWFGVLIAEDGDVHVAMHEPSPHTQEYGDPFPSVRIRTTYGGGRNLRTRQALLWLAEAMRLDNEENDKRYEAPNPKHEVRDE